MLPKQLTKSERNAAGLFGFLLSRVPHWAEGLGFALKCGKTMLRSFLKSYRDSAIQKAVGCAQSSEHILTDDGMQDRKKGRSTTTSGTTKSNAMDITIVPTMSTSSLSSSPIPQPLETNRLTLSLPQDFTPKRDTTPSSDQPIFIHEDEGFTTS
jgi:hypothetical protein